MGYKVDNLQTPKIDDKNMSDEEIYQNDLERFKTFGNVRDIISLLLNAEEMELNSKSFFDIISDDLSDKELEQVEYVFEQILTYIKVPESVITDLMSDDEELSDNEFNNIVELLAERIGDNDIDEFIYFALHNPELDNIQFDDIQYDWAFYKTESSCKKGEGDRKVPKSKRQVCSKGASGKLVGFWRYPKGDFPNGSYQRKKEGNRIAKAIPQFKNKRHKSNADLKRKTAQEKREKAGLATFNGFLKKRKEKGNEAV